MRRGLAALPLFLALALPATAAASGLHGVVTKGPTQPVCRVGEPCSAPAKGVRLTFTRNGVAHAAVTDAKGRYSIVLAAGTYRVAIAGARFGYTPARVYVPVGAAVRRDFSIDTGIR